MADYRETRISVNVAAGCLKDLFKDHLELQVGLNMFLPAKYWIHVTQVARFLSDVIRKFRKNSHGRSGQEIITILLAVYLGNFMIFLVV